MQLVHIPFEEREREKACFVVFLSSVRFEIVSFRSEKPICASLRLSEVPPSLLKRSYVRRTDCGPFSSCQF